MIENEIRGSTKSKVAIFLGLLVSTGAIGVVVGIGVASIKNVSYEVLMERLPELQQKTHTRIIASIRGALDSKRLPIAYRIGDSIKSLRIFSKNQPLSSGSWTETWEIQADGSSSSISLLVLRDRVCMVVLKPAPGSDATDRWSAILADLFPRLRQKRIAQ